MVFQPSWINGPNVLEAATAGTRAGQSRAQMIQDALEHAAQLRLQRDEMNQRAAQAAAALGQSGGLRTRELNIQENQDAAANALHEAALKQQGLYNAGRNQNYADKNSNYAARTLLEQKSTPFANTSNGLMQRDANGNWNLVPGSQRPAATKPENLGSIDVPADGVDPKNGTIRIPLGSTTYKNFLNRAPVVSQVPASGGFLGFGGTPAHSETNLPSLSEFVQNPSAFKVNAAASLTAPATVGAAQAPAIPQSHIDYLLANPNTVKQFEQLHGAGSAAKYLTQPVNYSNAPAEGGAAADLETPTDDE